MPFDAPKAKLFYENKRWLQFLVDVSDAYMIHFCYCLVR